MLRNLRRRFRGTRGETWAAFALHVTAVSPYPEEPEDEEEYRPSLIVAATPEPGDPALTPQQLAIGSLLFVEWAQQTEATLATRLQALIPRLRPAVKHAQLGPGRYAAHRAGQRERYFHHRDAATYAVTLQRDEDGLYPVVERRVAKGRWNEAATRLEAATLAPYEALLRLEPAEGLILLDWLAVATARWLADEPAGFPTAAWAEGEPLRAPEP